MGELTVLRECSKEGDDTVSHRPRRRRAEELCLVPCPGCGTPRLLTVRSRRRIEATGSTRCTACRFPRPPITDEQRRWWLKRLGDEEITELARGLFGVGDAQAVASWRLRLLG